MTTLQFYRSLIRYAPGLFALTFLGEFVGVGLFLATGLLTRTFFDVLTGHTSAQIGIWGIIALFIAAQIGRAVSVLGLVAADVTRTQVSSALIRTNVFERILQQPSPQALPYSSGEVIGRLRDDVMEAVGTVGMGGIIGILSTLTFVIVDLVILFRINARVTAFVFLPVVVMLIIGYAARARLERYRAASHEATAQVTGVLSEMFRSVQAVKLADAETRVIGHFRKLNAQRQDATVRAQLFNGVLDAIFGSTVSIGTGIILLLAAQGIRDNNFSVGDFAFFVYSLETFMAQGSWMATLWARCAQTGVYLSRLGTLLQGASRNLLVRPRPVHLSGVLPDVPPVVKTATDRLLRVEATGLTFHYPDSDRGVEDIDLWLDRGEFVVVTGRIGAGKTTLLRTLLGLLPANAGDIHWNGERVRDPASFFVPPRCAYIPQVPRLFSESLRDNILLGLPADQADVERAVQAAVLEHDLAQMADGLDTIVGSRGTRLSGGQAQRTVGARIFVRNTELVVIDDLASALDVETEHLLWQRLAARGQDTTYLVVSHRRDVLMRADRILVMKDGCLEAEGTLQTLLESCDELQALWSNPAEQTQEPSTTAKVNVED